MGEHKAAVRLVGLRHAKKGSTISEAWEIIGPALILYWFLEELPSALLPYQPRRDPAHPPFSAQASWRLHTLLGLSTGVAGRLKCLQGSKTNKSNCQVWKKLTCDWLEEDPSQDLFWPETSVIFDTLIEPIRNTD